ncbi:MAG TPA: hypothetical protein VFJ47_00650, partial [Terriglobales bacterium]|nr:hypothetical protein [Terriglobales bacterium]
MSPFNSGVRARPFSDEKTDADPDEQNCSRYGDKKPMSRSNDRLRSKWYDSTIRAIYRSQETVAAPSDCLH